MRGGLMEAAAPHRERHWVWEALSGARTGLYAPRVPSDTGYSMIPREK